MAEMDRMTAEAEFDKLVEIWELDFEEGDKEEKRSVENLKKKMVSGFANGKFSIDGETLVFKHRSGTLSFNVPKGEGYIEMDRTKENENFGKLVKFAAKMTNQTPLTINNLDGRDFKTVMAVTNLFIAG